MDYTLEEDMEFLRQLGEGSFEIRCKGRSHARGGLVETYTEASHARIRLFSHARVHDEDDATRGYTSPRPYLSYFAT